MSIAEWINVALGLTGLVIGALTGMIAAVWRVSRIEQQVRNDLRQELAEEINEMSQKIAGMADIFDETLKGLRQKINDVELYVHKAFVGKPEFEDFRKEYREDIRDLKHIINELARRP